MEKRIGGLFFSVNNDTGAVGFSFAVVYIPEYKEIQAVMQNICDGHSNLHFCAAFVYNRSGVCAEQRAGTNPMGMALL